MDFSNLDGAALVGDVIALAALVVSIVSICKSSKAEALQIKVAELDAKLKEYELSEAEENRAACVEARAISIGKSHRLRICNIGKEPAKNIDFEVLNREIAGLVMKDHVPFPELERQKSFDETFFATMGMPSVFDVKVTWDDNDGVSRSRVSHISW